ncbi:MAG: class I SAM-dependent methyltransferase [Spirochaetaceae bacterium]
MRRSIDQDDARCPVCRSEEVVHFETVRGRVYFRCLQCRATFLSRAQLPTAEQEKARYDEHNNDPRDPGYREFLNRLAQPLLERLPPGARGLDFGCGPGPALAGMLDEAGHEVSCYDPFYAPDPRVLDLQYDFITATEVLEHLHRPAETLDLFDAILRPGGYLGVMTEFLTDESRFAGWYYRQDLTHVVFYAEATLRRIAQLRGWAVEIPRKNVAIFRKSGRKKPYDLA